MRDTPPKTGHPVLDMILAGWGVVVAIASQLEQVQAALGIAVAVLTIFLLILRIVEHVRSLDEEATD